MQNQPALISKQALRAVVKVICFHPLLLTCACLLYLAAMLRPFPTDGGEPESIVGTIGTGFAIMLTWPNAWPECCIGQFFIFITFANPFFLVAFCQYFRRQYGTGLICACSSLAACIPFLVGMGNSCILWVLAHVLMITANGIAAWQNNPCRPGQRHRMTY